MTDATKTRVYVVEVSGQAPRLVRASHPLHAQRHVMEQIVQVRLASQDDLIELMAKGVRCENGGQGNGSAGDPRQGDFLGLGT